MSGSGSCGTRLLDVVLIKGGELRIARQTEVTIKGQDIVVIQAKAVRLGMYVMGQAFFSAQLMQRFAPRSVESVALVGQDDEVLRPLFEQYPGMRVVVCPADVMRPNKSSQSPQAAKPIRRSETTTFRPAPLNYEHQINPFSSDLTPKSELVLCL